MSFKAAFLHGEPVMVDHTPGSAVAAGDVVKVGNSVRVAHLDIAANVLGALAIGGGVYSVVKDTSAFAAGDTVYYDTSALQAISGTNANTVKLGQAVLAAGSSAANVTVLHIAVD